MQTCRLIDIIKTSSMVSFEDGHIRFLFDMMKKQHKNGLDANFHKKFVSTSAMALEKLREGIFVLSCPQIEEDYVFVYESAGKGLFGGQKYVFKVFAGNYERDNFIPGPSFKVFGIAVTSINNVFRHHGLIKGPIM